MESSHWRVRIEGHQIEFPDTARELSQNNYVFCSFPDCTYVIEDSQEYQCGPFIAKASLGAIRPNVQYEENYHEHRVTLWIEFVIPIFRYLGRTTNLVFFKWNESITESGPTATINPEGFEYGN
ncbi:hypothetical protein BC943DRAFT_338894 [Umbelopsis sp. AD052]|nr:hypothetical protein BC943DRAFT_338894 [Umbelopsis sp. AD052]